MIILIALATSNPLVANNILATSIPTSIEKNAMKAKQFKAMALNNLNLLIKNMSFKTIVSQ